MVSIQEELKKFLPQDVIWDFEDLSLTPPWGNNIAEHITNLSHYFITSSGKDSFEVLLTSFRFALEHGQNVSVKKYLKLNKSKVHLCYNILNEFSERKLNALQISTLRP